jgi:hypothetical protein
VELGTLRVHRRGNVSLGPLQEDRGESMEIEVARLQLETSELLTVQAIGSAIPVLLFLVELSTGRIYYVCLNDLVEKVILPQDTSYDTRDSKVLHIPARNCIIPGSPLTLRPLETYAKRAKLYAAFAKFAYQKHELDIALAAYHTAASGAKEREAARSLTALVRHFLSIDLRYDFWTRIPEWRPVEMPHIELRFLARFLQVAGADEDLESVREYLVAQPAHPLLPDYVAGLELPEAQWHLYTHAGQVWDRLDNLSRMYEELVREWFLPTELSMHLGQDLRTAAEPASAG